MSSQIGPAATTPAPSPASVTPSNRAAARPRRSSSPAVITAMKPRIDGTAAAVEAPSRTRVPVRTTRFVAKKVRTAATSPNNGPNCITRW